MKIVRTAIGVTPYAATVTAGRHTLTADEPESPRRPRCRTLALRSAARGAGLMLGDHAAYPYAERKQLTIRSLEIDLSFHREDQRNIIRAHRAARCRPLARTACALCRHHRAHAGDAARSKRAARSARSSRCRERKTGEIQRCSIPKWETHSIAHSNAAVLSFPCFSLPAPLQRWPDGRARAISGTRTAHPALRRSCTRDS